MKEVIIIQRIFPQYRKPIFDALHRKIDFVLLHSVNKSGIKQTSSPYSAQIKKWQYGKGDTQLFLDVFGYIKKERPKVIIHELAIGVTSLPFVILLKRAFGYKLILWGHMYNHKVGFNPGKSLGDRYRLWLHKKADAIITYSHGEKEKLVKHKVCSNKIFPALNTLDTNKYLPIRNELARIGKRSIKERLGFVHEYNLIFIGRLYEDKWPHYAIEVLHKIVEKNDFSVGLHFVGEGAMKDILLQYTNDNGLQNHVFFHGEIYDEYKNGELLFASDMMIMPGCVGLSINHAFCFDCPVITFESKDHIPAHGPEIEYIIHGQTGFIIKNRSIDSMLEVLQRYFNDKVLQDQVKAHIRYTIENVCTIEKLTEGFVGAIEYVTNKK